MDECRRDILRRLRLATKSGSSPTDKATTLTRPHPQNHHLASFAKLVQRIAQRSFAFPSDDTILVSVRGTLSNEPAKSIDTQGVRDEQV